MKEFNKEEYNKMCADFLDWELHFAKTALNYQDGTFMEWNDEEEFWIENPTEEFKQFRIVSHPQEVGLGYGFKLFKSYHYKFGLKFDSDWNWIMEVCSKLKTLPYEEVKSQEYDNLSHLSIGISKKRVVQAIWEFLNWYKENKN
jgi:hypothetical protein